jgi:hypothetical protein
MKGVGALRAASRDAAVFLVAFVCAGATLQAWAGGAGQVTP